MKKKTHDDFHLSLPTHFAALKMTDRRNEITFQHYLEFNACDEYCESKAECSCLRRSSGNWAENPLVRDYKAYIAKHGYMKAGEYLNRRIEYTMALVDPIDWDDLTLKS